MGNWKYIGLLVAVFVTLGFDCIESIAPSPPQIKPEFLQLKSPWADHTVEKMTLEEKIGQLLMVPAYSNGNPLDQAELFHLVDSFKVGGVIFMQGGPARQAQLSNILQGRSKTPLMVAMDAEWGLGMRLDSTISFPWQMALGAIQNEDLVYEFGREAGRHLKRMGVHISFSPVVDVNNNANNPVINARSFGEDREEVARRGIEYMKGLQDAGVLACAKHFPGHGDTDVDSHKDLPTISHARQRLDSIELYPFQKLADQGLGSAMIAHLYIPALDSVKGNPSTMSEAIVTGILKEEMGFEGLIFTDAMTMKGLANYYEPGEMHVQALKAGNDVLLFPGDVPLAMEKIVQAVEDSVLSEELITERCHRILKFKEWAGLHISTHTEQANIVADLNTSASQAVQYRLISESLTLLKNDKNLVPIVADRGQKIAVLNVGDKKDNAFCQRFSTYFDFDGFAMPSAPDFATTKKLTKELSGYDLVVVNILNSSRRPSKNYGVNQQAVRLSNAVSLNTKVILNIFSNPYSLGNLLTPDKASSLLIAYHDDDVTQRCVADAIAGAFRISGRLPITANKKFKKGAGVNSIAPELISSVPPELVSARKSDLDEIDSIAAEGIAAGAFPGCRVLAVKDGKIFYDKAFGYQTYDKKIAVDLNTVYDIASITKIVASTMALMKLQDEGKINVDYNLCDYLPLSDTAECFNINLREMLSHFARLKSWIPFYAETVHDGELDKALYRTTSEVGFTTRVTDDLYIKDSYRDSIYHQIVCTSLRLRQEYNYSDLGYYFVQDIIQSTTDTTLQAYVMDNIYAPLNLNTIGYLPLERIPIERIAPTENDTYFRHQLVHGHVHDPGAAMMGGVGGHAGVFSDAYDLAVLMQMLVNGGQYGGKRILNEGTINYFTDCHYCEQDNRRGIGFDKPTSILDAGPTCNSASASSFGHSGFTGTLVWADPEHDIVYVFLSNRVYPDGTNRKLLEMDIRTRIQQVIYDAFDIPARKVESVTSDNLK